jgi:hypothetical protein
MLSSDLRSAPRPADTEDRELQLSPRPAPAGSAARRDRWPTTVRVVAWDDPVVDRLGHDPRSVYVETFWLGVLGPSSTWLLRRLAWGLEADPTGVLVELDELAGALGLGGRTGRHVPLLRALDRCISFGMARPNTDRTELAVRRRLPPLAQRHLLRLPSALRQQHAAWAAERLRAREEQHRERARRLALSLVRLGEEQPAVEAQLARWQVHPALAHEAVRWALAQPVDTTTSCRPASPHPPSTPGSPVTERWTTSPTPASAAEV